MQLEVEVWNALAPSSLISVAWEMDTTQASLRRGANLPVLAGVLRCSVCRGCCRAGRRKHNACEEGLAQGGVRLQVQSDCLGKEEGRKGCS